MKKEYNKPICEIIIYDMDIVCDIFGSSEYGDTLLDYEELFGEDE